MEKKTDRMPDLGLRGLLQGIIPGAASIVLTVMTACRRALSPAIKELMEKGMVDDIKKSIEKGINMPPPAEQDPENSRRYTVTFPITFPDLTEVSDNSVERAISEYNIQSEDKRPRKSKVLTWRRIDGDGSILGPSVSTWSSFPRLIVNRAPTHTSTLQWGSFSRRA